MWFIIFRSHSSLVFHSIYSQMYYMLLHFSCSATSWHLSNECETLFSLYHSHGGAGDEKGLALCTTLPLLCEGDEDPGLQPAARVIPFPHPGLHGWGLWCQHRVHRPVSASTPRLRATFSGDILIICLAQKFSLIVSTEILAVVVSSVVTTLHGLHVRSSVR